MVAGVELQQKLLHRLRALTGEAPPAGALTPEVDKKPSPSKSSRDEDRLEDLASEASRLRQQILNARKERDLARRRRQSHRTGIGKLSHEHSEANRKLSLSVASYAQYHNS